jgi:hypothetical protein
MNASLHLPGLTATHESGRLLIECSGEDQLCGLALLYAVSWCRNATALGKVDKAASQPIDAKQTVLQQMQELEAIERRQQS